MLNQAINKGYLILIGGAEDRKDDKLILKTIVNECSVKTIGIIPSASSYPTGVSEDYYYAFKDLGVENILVFDIRSPEEADETKFLEQLETVDLVFMSGGDQVKLFNVLKGTKFLDKMKNLHYNKKLHIAGTSAGAAVASNPMIYDGNINGLIKGSVSFSEGFGLIENVTIDTHFISRGRLGRLTQFLCTGISKRGIGIGEDTAIFILPDNTFYVVGSGMVTVVDTENLTYNNYNEIKEDEPIVIHGINVGFLQHGSCFDLKDWKVISCKKKDFSHSETYSKEEKTDDSSIDERVYANHC